jgi:hypothetical protein
MQIPDVNLFQDVTEERVLKEVYARPGRVAGGCFESVTRREGTEIRSFDGLRMTGWMGSFRPILRD